MENLKLVLVGFGVPLAVHMQGEQILEICGGQILDARGPSPSAAQQPPSLSSPSVWLLPWQPLPQCPERLGALFCYIAEDTWFRRMLFIELHSSFNLKLQNVKQTKNTQDSSINIPISKQVGPPSEAQDRSLNAVVALFLLPTPGQQADAEGATPQSPPRDHKTTSM